MDEKRVDFAAAGRVANRVELKDIRVVNVTATCNPKIKGVLEPTLNLDCRVANHERDTVEIACEYRFIAKIAESEVAEALIKYLLLYDVKGTEPLVDDDLIEFAIGNGTLHSWPFVREFLHGLTSRMGYPPYTLPVFHFKPKIQPKKEIKVTPAPSSSRPVSPKPAKPTV